MISGAALTHVDRSKGDMVVPDAVDCLSPGVVDGRTIRHVAAQGFVTLSGSAVYAMVGRLWYALMAEQVHCLVPQSNIHGPWDVSHRTDHQDILPLLVGKSQQGALGCSGLGQRLRLGFGTSCGALAVGGCRNPLSWKHVHWWS